MVEGFVVYHVSKIVIPPIVTILYSGCPPAAGVGL
jgi:hypothetical protein